MPETTIHSREFTRVVSRDSGSLPFSPTLLAVALTLIASVTGITPTQAAQDSPKREHLEQTTPVLIAMSDEVRELCQKAEQAVNSGATATAFKLLDKAEKLDPTCAEVHGYRGLAYQNSGKTQKAIEEYEKGLSLNPQMSFLLINIGNCYLNLNAPDKAAPYFQRFLAENPDSPDSARARQALAMAGGRKSEGNLRSTFEEGQAKLQQKRYQEAEGLFNQAIAMKPDWAPAHFFLAYSLGSEGKHREAIAEFQKSLALDRTMSDAVLNIASNYQSMGDCNAAISWYERYLQENPSSPKTRDIRARIDGLRRQAQQAPSHGPAQSVEADNYLREAMAGGRRFRWNMRKMPLRVFIAPKVGIQYFPAEFDNVLVDAFSRWSKASGGAIQFRPVSDPREADVICSWTTDPARVIEKGRAVEGGLTKLSAQASPSPTDADISRAEIVLLVNDGQGRPLSTDAMKIVCLHEIGHALGINGHSSDNKDIMFFSESPSMWPSLTKRDVATIQLLYDGFRPGL